MSLKHRFNVQVSLRGQILRDQGRTPAKGGRAGWGRAVDLASAFFGGEVHADKSATASLSPDA